MWGKREFISFPHAGKLRHPVLLPVSGLRCWKWYLWGLCWCGDLPLPWQSVTRGPRSFNALGISLGSHQPYLVLEMGDTAKGMWWLSHRSQLPQPPRGVFWRTSYRPVSSCIPAHLLSFPSAWRHCLRVAHLHPAGGHDIPEVGGTSGAQRPHHAVRGTSRPVRQLGDMGTQEGPVEGCIGGVSDNLCCLPWGIEAAAAIPEPFGFSTEPLAASRLPCDHPLL